MTTATLKVIDAGPGVTLQDNGRPGYQRYGVTEGGAMDRWALAECNLLLGNKSNTAALEMIAVGGMFTVTEKPVRMATSGAAMGITLDGKALPWRSSFTVEPGQVLHCSYARESIYSYLQAEGGFAVPPVLESASTYARSDLGGYEGRSLRVGDELPLAGIATASGADPVTPVIPRKLPVPEYFARDVIRIVWGTQAQVFSSEVREALLQGEFSVSAERDRMGARLATDVGSMAAATGLSGVSDAVVLGDIQIAGDGVATVLLADRQPTGGYPRIATVITADLNAVSQMPTHKPFGFQLVTTDEAVAALAAQQQEIKSLQKRMTSVTRLPEDVTDLLKYSLVDGVVSAKDR